MFEKLRRPIRTLALAVLLTAPGLAVGADDASVTDTLRQAEALLAAHQPAEAWQLLAPRELDSAGSPWFDYLYGIAALDTGRRDAAITALERVLAREPDFAGARMELARARYETGDYPGASEQFEYLLTQSPPPGTRVVIDQYLLAMHEGPGTRSRFTPYVELGAGWDSNANASTGSDTFGVFVLDPDNVETSSAFIEMAAGFQHGLATGPDSALLTNGRLSHRFNPDARFVDQTLASLGTALQKSWGMTRTSLGVSGYYGWLDGEQHEVGAGADLGLGRRFATDWELDANGSAGVVRYQQDVLEVLDVNRYLGSVVLTRSGIGAANGRLGVVALFGQDGARQDDSPYSNDRLGGRVFTSWRLGSRNSLLFDAGFLHTDFDNSPGFFGIDRKDDQWHVGLSAEFQDWPAAGYSLLPTLRYINTDSTVSLYEYDRFELGVILRRSKR